jgi:hypothetical protein
MAQNKKSKKYNRLLNLLWLIPVITLGYIGWVNFMPLGGTLSYSIDVGWDDTAGIARITGPFDRISAQMQADGETFRELEQSLVYFELDETALRKADRITVTVRFRDNFNNDEKFVLGARNAPEWSYYWKNIYVPFYSELSELPLVATNDAIHIYSTDPGNTTDFASVEDFLQNPPTGAVIATNDKNLPINELVDLPHDDIDEGNSSVINSSLRGSHTLWTYVNNSTLNLKVSKQDLNWYEEPDDLTIEIYSLDGELIGEATIPDDGDVEESKNLGPLQEASLSIDILEPGVYCIELKGNSDLLITRLEINQPKLVVEKRAYLSGENKAYYPDETDSEPVTLYGYNQSEKPIRFYTWHNSGLQNIVITGDDYDTVANINQVKTDFFVDIPPGSYQMTFPQQDILIDSAGFLAFSPESYFLPKRCELVDLKYYLSWLVDNVDYIVINAADYIMPEEDAGWLIAQTEWQREDLYLIDNKLSFCFNVPHLTEEPDRSIPIDRIEIRLEILPIWKR